MWIIGVLAATPWVPWIKDNYHVIARWPVAYGLAVLGFFILVVVFLALQYQGQEWAQYELAAARGNGLKPLPKCAAFRRKGTAWKSIAFTVIGLGIWGIWACALWHAKF
jgi:hypothetical protein